MEKSTIERSNHTIFIDPIQVGMHTKRDLTTCFNLRATPFLYGSKLPTKTHETLLLMELPNDVT